MLRRIIREAVFVVLATLAVCAFCAMALILTVLILSLFDAAPRFD